MNWVDINNNIKKIKWVGVDDSLHQTINWTTLCNESNNHELGDKFEKLVTAYLKQLDGENRPT